MVSNIRTPRSIREEFTVEVPARVLRRVRDGLEGISQGLFSAAELSLAIASLAAGGILAALQSGVGPESNRLWWLFYSILPAITAGGITNYLRHRSRSVPALKARDLLTDFPDPDQATPMFDEIERLAGAWALESVTATSGKKSAGSINFSVTRGRIHVAGQLYGESGSQIATISSEVCDFQPRTKQLLLVYRLAAYNEDNVYVIVLCILNATLFHDSEDAGPAQIKGNWFHLHGDPSTTRPGGTAILKRLSKQGPK